MIRREIITKIGIIEAIPPLRACNSVKLPMLCERKMPEIVDVVLWRARAKRLPSRTGAPVETRLVIEPPSHGATAPGGPMTGPALYKIDAQE